MSLRDVVRSTTTWVAQVVLSPLLLLCAVEKALGSGEAVFTTCSQLLALFPGAPGSLIRKAFYMATLDGCADRAHFAVGTFFAHREAVVFPDAYVGAYCVLGRVTIGQGANVASRVSITSGRHQHSDGALAEPVLGHVTIGHRAWIGEGAIVMADVGDDAVVGAGAVVVSPVPAGAKVAGNPARPIAAAASAATSTDRPVA
ncbi:MAG: acyltransferase [Alphaproteobacteria bacterium]